MALTISEDVVNTLGSARVQTPALAVDRLDVPRIARGVDNTSSQSDLDRSMWQKVSPNPSLARFAGKELDWVGALIRYEALTTRSTFPLPAVLRGMIDVLERISYASELPEGWFERGSVGLTERAREAAIDFVSLLAIEGLLAKGASLDVIPTPIGGIQFEWAGEHGEIEVEIDAHGRFHTLVERPDGSLHESPRSTPMSATSALPQIRRILG